MKRKPHIPAALILFLSVLLTCPQGCNKKPTVSQNDLNHASAVYLPTPSQQSEQQELEKERAVEEKEANEEKLRRLNEAWRRGCDDAEGKGYNVGKNDSPYFKDEEVLLRPLILKQERELKDLHDDEKETRETYYAGYNATYLADYLEGVRDALPTAYKKIYDLGNEDGYDWGYDEGHGDGHTEGYEEGHAEGRAEGYEDGYDIGYGEGYNKGREDQAKY